MESHVSHRLCDRCRTASSKGFAKILNLQDSGLNIYIYNKNDKENSVNKAKVVKSIIMHNTTNRELDNKQLIREIGQYNSDCLQCKLLIRLICNLVNNVNVVNTNEVFGICEHCKASNTTSKCKRCDYVVKTFFKNKEYIEEHDEQCKKSLLQIKSLLENIPEENLVSEKELKQKCVSAEESQKIAKLIKVPSNDYMAGGPYFTSLETLKLKNSYEDVDVNIGKKFVHKTLSNANSEIDGQGKYLTNKNLSAKELTKTPKEIKLNNNTPKEIKLNNNTQKEIKLINNTQKEIKLKNTSLKAVSDTSQMLFMKMIQKQQKNRKREEYILKRLEKVRISDLPPIPVKVLDASEESVESGAIVKCDDINFLEPTEMIKGCQIIPFNQHHKHLIVSNLKPLLFEVQPDVSSDMSHEITLTQINNNSKILQSERSNLEGNNQNNNVIIRYQLSNKKFIEDGWTLLPTLKTMRRINIYKVIPINEKYDWYETLKKKKQMFYLTGEKLIETGVDRRSRLYYRDGKVAFECYDGQVTNSKKKYFVYDVPKLNKNAKSKVSSLLACFDNFGNGIVYDNFGRIRLKYNQSEGFVFDAKIGPFGRWKWHNLNDPPVLEQVFVDNSLSPTDECVNKINDEIKQVDFKSVQNKLNEEILAVELDNFIKETSKKVLMKYKPFEIRAKAFKLNEYFSLKIITQSKVYLFFKCAGIYLKINLGIKLISNEIIGTELVDIEEVVTPYDNQILK